MALPNGFIKGAFFETKLISEITTIIDNNLL